MTCSSSSTLHTNRCSDTPPSPLLFICSNQTLLFLDPYYSTKAVKRCKCDTTFYVIIFLFMIVTLLCIILFIPSTYNICIHKNTYSIVSALTYFERVFLPFLRKILVQLLLKVHKNIFIICKKYRVVENKIACEKLDRLPYFVKFHMI